jgi:hypothetical protein
MAEEQQIAINDNESFAREMREKRNRLLIECDWTQGVDVPDDIKLAWQPYRQALRDITSNYTDIRDVVWPTPPA